MNVLGRTTRGTNEIDGPETIFDQTFKILIRSLLNAKTQWTVSSQKIYARDAVRQK